MRSEHDLIKRIKAKRMAIGQKLPTKKRGEMFTVLSDSKEYKKLTWEKPAHLNKGRHEHKYHFLNRLIALDSATDMDGDEKYKALGEIKTHYPLYKKGFSCETQQLFYEYENYLRRRSVTATKQCIRDNMRYHCGPTNSVLKVIEVKINDADLFTAEGRNKLSLFLDGKYIKRKPPHFERASMESQAKLEINRQHNAFVSALSAINTFRGAPPSTKTITTSPEKK